MLVVWWQIELQLLSPLNRELVYRIRRDLSLLLLFCSILHIFRAVMHDRLSALSQVNNFCFGVLSFGSRIAFYGSLSYVADSVCFEWPVCYLIVKHIWLLLSVLNLRKLLFLRYLRYITLVKISWFWPLNRSFLSVVSWWDGWNKSTLYVCTSASEAFLPFMILLRLLIPHKS